MKVTVIDCYGTTIHCYFITLKRTKDSFQILLKKEDKHFEYFSFKILKNGKLL